MRLFFLLILLPSTLLAQPAEQVPMTPERMIALLSDVVDDMNIEGSVVEFVLQEVPMLLVYDLNANRMRLVSPIVEVANLQEGQLTAAMEANFHSALDARYAISNGIVWSAFVHPLADLSEQLFMSAVLQVATARATFGSEYSSGAMTFGDQ